MGPIFAAVILAEIQIALLALCLVIAFATPTGRRSIGSTILIFGGSALGGFLGVITWYGAALAAVLVAAAGATALRALGEGWIVLGTLCFAYIVGTVLGGRVGWRLSRRDRPEVPRTGMTALQGSEAQ
jgi:hypothetical protein